MKKISRGLWVAGGVLVIIVVLGVSLFRGREVEVFKLARQDIVQRVVSIARIEAHSTVELGVLVPGNVRQVLAKEGDRVTAGQLLLELDDADAQAGLRQARAALDQARARRTQLTEVGALVAEKSARQAELALKQAEADFARERELFDSKVTTAETLEAAHRRYDGARALFESASAQLSSARGSGAEVKLALAGVASAEAAVATAEARVRQMRIVSPSAGTILKRTVDVGDVVQPGKNLITLGGEGLPFVVAQVDEKSLGLLSVGQRAQVVADAYPGEPFEARLSSLASAVDPNRGTIETKFEITAPPPFLKPEMSVTIAIEIARKHTALSLPVRAIHDLASAKPWVMTVEEGRSVQRFVEIGIKGENVVEIVSGIEENSLVIPTDVSIESGRRVRPKVTLLAGSSSATRTAAR